MITLPNKFDTQTEFFVAADNTVVTRAQERLAIQSVSSAAGIDQEALEQMNQAYNELTIYQGDVTSGIPLDTIGMNNATIRWESSDSHIIDAGGNVYPTVGQAHKVTLTATISCAGMTWEKVFSIDVPAVQPYAVKGIQVTGDDGIVDNALVGGKTISAVKMKRFVSAAQPVNLLYIWQAIPPCRLMLWINIRGTAGDRYFRNFSIKMR